VHGTNSYQQILVCASAHVPRTCFRTGLYRMRHPITTARRNSVLMLPRLFATVRVAASIMVYGASWQEDE
jgi:hypothetical protein